MSKFAKPVAGRLQISFSDMLKKYVRWVDGLFQVGFKAGSAKQFINLWRVLFFTHSDASATLPPPCHLPWKCLMFLNKTSIFTLHGSYESFILCEAESQPQLSWRREQYKHPETLESSQTVVFLVCIRLGPRKAPVDYDRTEIHLRCWQLQCRWLFAAVVTKAKAMNW